MNDKQIKRNRIADFLPAAIRIAKKHLYGPLSRLAEDAAQDALIKALEKEHLFPGKLEKFEHWLYTIVKNTCTDMARKKRELLTKEGDVSSLAATECSEESDKHERREAYKNLKRSIHKLPDRDKKVILLRDFFKCSGKETAAYLGIPQSNVHVYYQRAKKRLSALIIE